MNTKDYKLDVRSREKFVCKCGHIKFIGIEYYGMDTLHYDGVSEYMCEKCKTRYGRWCGTILKRGEGEPPFHDGGKHPKFELERK